HANRRRKIKVLNRLAYVINSTAQVRAFQTRCDGNIALEIFAANFSLPWNLDDVGQRSQCSGLASGSCEQVISNRVELYAVPRGKSNTQRISAVMSHDGRARCLAF